MKLIEKLYCKLQKYYIATFEIVVVNAAVPCSNNDLQHNFSNFYIIRRFLVKVKGLKILVVDVAPSQRNKFLRHFYSRYVKCDNFINIKTSKQSFLKWISEWINCFSYTYFVHLLFMVDIPFTLKKMWTFFVGRSTFSRHRRMKSLVCLSVFLSVCPSLSFLKIGSLFFFWYCTWQLTVISSDWPSHIFEKK